MTQLPTASSFDEEGAESPSLSTLVDENQLEAIQGGRVIMNIEVSSTSNINPAKLVNSALSSKVSLSGGDLTIDSKI